MGSEKKTAKGDNDKILQFSGFYLDDALCGVNIDLVQEINANLVITPVPLSSEYVLGIMNLRGQIVTVIDQGRKLGFKPSEITKKSRIIIVKSQDEHIGLLVDQITEVITARKSEISDPPPNIKGMKGKYFRGVVHTNTNELLAILDVEAVLGEE